MMKGAEPVSHDGQVQTFSDVVPATAPTQGAVTPHPAAIQNVLSQLAEEANTDRLTRLVPVAFDALASIRDHDKFNWKKRVIPWIQSSVGFTRLQEDPLTNHCFRRPRGYAGDACLLDYIYAPGCLDMTGVTPAGRAIYRYTAAAPEAQAVRNRRALLRRKVYDLAQTRPGRLRVASLACGHLREAELVPALETRRIESYWAIDQDELSLEHVRRSFRGSAVKVLHGGVRDLLKGGLEEVDGLDFFYAAGLFDYLEEGCARRLVSRMFERLRPGGTLWVANFLPAISGRGYMEAVMDWWLIYRSVNEVAALDGDVNAEKIARKNVFLEGEGCIAFLELQKDGSLASGNLAPS